MTAEWKKIILCKEKVLYRGFGMDISDRVKIASLLSEYAALLTDRQREMLRMYVEMDMSLAEVAEEYGVTRQAVLDAVRHAADSLQRYEDAVKVVALKRDLVAALDKASEGDPLMQERLKAAYELLEG